MNRFLHITSAFTLALAMVLPQSAATASPINIDLGSPSTAESSSASTGSPLISGGVGGLETVIDSNPIAPTEEVPGMSLVIAGIAFDLGQNGRDSEHPAILALESRLAGHTGLYKDIAITQCDNYVNIRRQPSVSAEVEGKIYNNSAAHIEATLTNDEGIWYKVHSGSCNGYIKAEYFLTGSEAEDYAPSVSTMYATVNTETLRLREKPSLDSETVSLLSADEKYRVSGTEGEFYRLQVDEDLTGYVYGDYVKISIKYKEAISIEEEQAELARLAELERQRRLAEEAAEKARIEASKAASRAAAQKTKSSSSTKSTKSTKSTTEYTGSVGSNSGSVSDSRHALCDYAESWVGVTPYVYGGTSLTNGADCSGFVQQVFKKFGISLPRDSYSQRDAGDRISADEIRPGDIVCYSGHVAIYIGDGQVVHASSASSSPNTKYSSWNYRSVICIVNPWGD
ncbi:MAG: C40 family peptidase [Lachnospiraceae bacterium]|nr:C40 family peptidase [Lachnospiraceae bacterium]